VHKNTEIFNTASSAAADLITIESDTTQLSINFQAISTKIKA